MAATAPASPTATRSPDTTDAYARLVADKLRDIVVVADGDRRIRFVTPSCAALGYAPEDMIGREAVSFAHPGDVERMRANMARLVAGEPVEPRDLRYRLRLKDGAYRWYESNPMLLKGDRGELSGLVTCLRDVTGHIAVEAALAEAESRHRMLADNMGDFVVHMDRNDRITYVSPACRITGYTPEELIGRCGSDFAHPEDRIGLDANVARLLNGQDVRPGPMRTRFRMKDGRWRWFEGQPARIIDASGATVGMVNVLRDVHEQRIAEEALAASESRYRLLADNMSDLLACSGRDGQLSFVAGAWPAILGYEPHEMLGRDAPSFVHPDDLERVRDEFRKALRAGPGGGAFRVEYRAQRKDGGYVWLEAHPRPFFAPDGTFIEFQDIVRDISGHKALEDRLEAERQAAEQTAKARAEFLADLAHELRGPLNSIQGLARLARKRPGLQEPARGYMTRIEEATGAILVQVEDVLEFSRLEAAKVVFRPRPVELEPFAAAALAQFEPAARAKGLTLEHASTAAPGLVLAFDPDRLRQVVLNLLDNAVKFTTAGTIRLETGYDAAAGRLTVAVADTGLGMRADQLQQLFQRFTQVSEKPSYRGAGLGLSISKRIVEGVGGEIGATSKVGRGSRFTFSIPAPVAEAEAAETDAAEPAPRLRLLVADADPQVAASVAEAFGAVSAEVVTAADGAAALDIALREPFDVILIDLTLHGPDAHTVLGRLRRRRGFNKATPALAMMTDAADLPADDAVTGGFETLVAKPLTRIQLVSAVIQTLRSPRTGRD